ncbi:S1 family peptidase [Phormidium sp. CCY1219]|uniref:S1 family peptidase n=1 Tax=Phormidium sp. CCY1219 TaxID=2886104 RepID=UPI002D1F5172|nr:trypsin-like peptidase domain-containing protein [Phormidium sp. CCY1219]MEB3829901.1 trypsin-like peptidase domain-containing protein [Phormidium sp. CCY1219]
MVVVLGSLFVALPGKAVEECISAPVLPEGVPQGEPAGESTGELDRLYQLAESITVKVYSNNTNGSGILIQRQGSLYTVVTNEHVLTLGPPYRIETADGRSYPAEVLKSVSFNGKDLALLQFSSAENYTLASFGAIANLTVGEPVFAAGFPFGGSASHGRGFAFKTGEVSLLPDKALPRGYQLGYTNPIEKGMSGGPVLNRQGQVVGINGMHAYPLWGDPYVFEDGSRPCQGMREIMTRSSWAIPIETLVQLAQNLSLPRVDSPVRLPEVAQTPIPQGQSPAIGDIQDPSISPAVQVPRQGLFQEPQSPASPIPAVPQNGEPMVSSVDGFWIMPVNEADRFNSMPESNGSSIAPENGGPRESNIAPRETNQTPEPLW